MKKYIAYNEYVGIILMFHDSAIDNIYPSVSDQSEDEISKMASYEPDVGKLQSAYRSAYYTTKGLGEAAIGVVAAVNDTVGTKAVYDMATEGHLTFSDSLSMFKKSAEANITGSYTSGNHPFVDFAANTLPFIAADVATLGFATPELAAARAASTALENSVTPMSMLTSPLAKEFGVNAAIAGQGSLTLDKHGNLAVDKEALAIGSGIGLAIPLLVRGAAKSYKALNRSRVVNEPPRITGAEVEDAPIISRDNDGNIEPATRENTDALIDKYSNDIMKDKDTSDIKLPETDNVTKNLLLDTANLSDRSHLFTSANAVQDMVDEGVHIDGVRYEMGDAALTNVVSNTVDHMEAIKIRRGSEKVALTKTIHATEGREKWADIIDKADKVPYRSAGAIKNDTGEFFYNFKAKSINMSDLDRLKKAAPTDDTAHALLALQHLSSAHNFDANLATLKSLSRNIVLYKNGILDLRANWDKVDSQKLNDFVEKVHAQYADYFTNPLSSGYVKLSRSWAKAEKLIDCLIGAIS